MKYEDVKIGDTASFSKTVTEHDVYTYAGVTGDLNPVHINEEVAKASMFKTRIAHGMLSAGFISAVLGTQLPGPGTIYLNQEMKFLGPVMFGDTVTATVEVLEKRDDKYIIVLKTTVTNQDGKTLVDGKATVMQRT